MINLLPPTEKKIVSDEKRKRVILILLFFLVVFLVLASGVMYGTVRYGVEILNREMDVFREAKTKLTTVNEKSEDIKELNQTLEHIDQISKNSIGVNQVYLMVEEKMPAGVEIKKLKINRSSDDYEVVLTGHAPKWEELVALEDNLAEFSEVNFSADTWKQAEDIDFLVKFIIDESEK